MIFRSFVSRPTYFACLAVGTFFFGAEGAWALNLTAAANAQAKNGGSSSASSTSQSATAATANTAQSLQSAAVTLRAQAALQSSLSAFQALQSAQQSAQLTAQANAAVNLTDAAHNIINGLTATGATSSSPGGLSPVGGLNKSTSTAVQVVDLSGGSQNQLAVTNGGSVTLSGGTAGSDQVAISGAAGVTTTAGTVTATAGSVTTSVGGTLAANNGATIALTAGSATLKTTTPTMMTSTDPGSYTLNGSTVTFTANTATAIPSGATVSFTGSSAATVTVAGAATVQLSGAGTMSLASSGSGAITASGSSSFTAGAVISSQAAGSTVTFSGSGSLAFNSKANDTLAVIVQPNSSNVTPSFSTTGVVLATQGYNVPQTWSGVQDFSESYNAATGQWVDTVTQGQQTALLYWTSFNIGKSTTLDFDQSAGGANAGDWVAYNRILDPSLNPSQIFGAIQASGQVYVINQNGIIFNGSSQVNAHALVASTLPINTNLVTSGLLQNPDMQYLFSSVAIPAGTTTAAYDPNNDVATITLANNQTITQANTLPNVTSGNIVVDQGATLTSPGSETGVGGKIALIAPNVTNNGDVSAPDGQVIMAAGEQVGIVAHPGTDASLRGLDVAIGQAKSTDTVINGGTADSGGSAASNAPVGLINAPEADVTLAAPNIRQDGIIESQTSVSLNGRIDLLAMSGLKGDVGNQIFDALTGGGAKGGSIVLGANSVTSIVPDYSSSDTEVGTSLALPSEVYAEGLTFEMKPGAQLIAPNATMTFGLGILNESITAAAGQTSLPLAENVGSRSTTTSSGAPIAGLDYLTAGSFTLDPGAYVDVSGSSDVQASVAENIVAAQLTDAVLENSPLQLQGVLHDDTVDVDITQNGTNADGSTWVGSPLGDFSGYANLVEHTVGELTVAGGSVAIYTNGQATVSPDATINVSGGSIDYAGATVQTTYLVTSSGSIINIEQASPSVEYEGLYSGFTTSSSKWGVSTTDDSGLLDGTYNDPGYVEGGNAGSLSIVAPTVSLQGAMYGNITMGARQQITPPKAGVFSLNIEKLANTASNPPVLNIVIQPGSDAASTAANTIDLSQDIFGADGFGNATINTGSGKITVAQDATIAALPGSSLVFTAANIEVDGKINDPSGSVQLTALTQAPLAVGSSSPYNAAIGNLSLGDSASISVGGLTFDELSNTAPGRLPFDVNGGSVSLSGAIITLPSGSAIDASGGLARSAAGKVYSGTGGSLALTGYYSNTNGSTAGSLVLDGSLTAYGIGQGGSLSLNTLAVAVGDASSSTLINGATPLVLPSDFFSAGGFSSYSIAGSAGVTIENGTVISPVLTEEVANLNESQFGVSLASSSQLPAYPAAPVNLSFSAAGATQNIYAQVTLGSGASITLPATSSLAFTGQLIDIQGSAVVPGGNITIQGASTGNLLNPQIGQFVAPVVTVDLEAGSSLSVSGEVLTTPTQVGSTTYDTGAVLAGGSISIKGNIAGASSASLSADGTVGTIEVATSSTTGAAQSENLSLKLNPYTSETIASNGGNITLNGDEELYYTGLLSAKAGNGTATGGSFTLGSGLATTYTKPPAAGYPDIYIEQTQGLSVGNVTLGQTLAGAATTGGAYITVNQVESGGFGSLIFNGNVEFMGGGSPISLSASKEILLNLSSTSGSLFADGSNEAVTLTAPYIAIGAPTLSLNQQSVSADAPIYVAVQSNGSTVQQATPTLGLADPTYGPATLTLNATDLINVTFLSMQNFGTTNLNVASGDIRGGGLFYAAGNINLTAGQIYPPTGATFTIAAFGSNNSVNGGTIDIEAGDSRSLPYSAGATLNIYATNIIQDGNLEAPFGTINLGSLTSSTTGQTAVLATVTPTLNSTTDQYYAVGTTTQFAPVTSSLILGPHSTTSVSGVSGDEVLDLPYGTIENGTDWIAPNGSDITAGGLIGKGVTLQASSVHDETGSVIDIAGGGSLFAYAFNPGLGGTNDILSVYKYANGAIEVTSSGASIASTSFAIVPSYDLDYAPIDLTVDSTGATPYANATLTSNVGNEIYLEGGEDISAGSYVILPARYALLPNAYLVTPESGAATQASANPDGSLNIAGYTYNSLNANQQLVPVVTEFLVDTNAVVNEHAPYEFPPPPPSWPQARRRTTWQFRGCRSMPGRSCSMRRRG